MWTIMHNSRKIVQYAVILNASIITIGMLHSVQGDDYAVIASLSVSVSGTDDVTVRPS